MSVISVREITGREFEAGENMNRRDVRKYRIICDIPNQIEPTIVAQADMPAILAPHPEPLAFPGLRCTSVRLAQEDAADACIWIATVTWSALTLGRSAANTSVNPEQRNQNPLSRPAILYFGQERFQRTMIRDMDGNAIVNSAGDPFEQGVVKDEVRPTFTITKNVSTFPLNLWRDATNSVNADTFLGLDPGTVRLVSFTGQEGFENDITFFTQVGSFSIASDFEKDWKAHPLDCGYQQLVGGELTEIFLPGGMRPSTPPRLNGAGVPLAPGDPSVFLDFTLYHSYVFGDLGFF